jgi:hypothetical protein
VSTGTNIVDEVRAQLNDSDSANYRWSDAEMLRYVNAGQRQIVHMVPESNVITTSVSTPTANEVRHTIPAGGIKFVSLFSADSQNETSPANAIRECSLDSMNTLFPEWSYSQVEQPRVPNLHDIWNPGSSGDGQLRYENFMHDPVEPKIYYVYPIPPASGDSADLEVVYVDLPSDNAGLGNNFRLRDHYQNAMVLYVTYRCLRKDGRQGGGRALRTQLWNDFRTALGLSIQGATRVSPDNPRNAPPRGRGQ